LTAGQVNDVMQALLLIRGGGGDVVADRAFVVALSGWRT
jgi:hypothetical protein